MIQKYLNKVKKAAIQKNIQKINYLNFKNFISIKTIN